MSGRFRAAVVGAALSLIAGHDVLAAETGPPLRIGHYSSGNGLIGLVIDRMGTPVKVRFDGSEEILALTAEQAPYNSIALKRDDGVSVLRIYETGRILIFSDKLPDGSADAYRDQDAEPLVVKKATKEQAETEAESLGRKLRRAGAPALAISLDAPRLSADAAEWSAMADAIAVTGITLAEMLTSPIAREVIAAKLRRVVIRDADQADVKLADDTLIVEVEAKAAVTGRPSSARLRSAIGDLL
ncbi:DUF4908 domain-containing protein [Bradyrhizobium sp. CB3481]|uniref:DUF4908 domain-containing protein n=1 Tax=Bradyrhizobium sp. CB3481 TaxID=3039158 RepID=UPI0024B07DE3|nr:DUF4908 domain-containing protein [Bradyrhizobium sp. CB3481]WFU19376.1 DUF4908 domain-containing protein [Bradyrhizobium sp. CB3481]